MVVTYAVISVILFACIGYSTGFYYGQKSRSVIIKYSDNQIKIPELLEKSGISATDDQILRLNRELNSRNEVGFKP